MSNHGTASRVRQPSGDGSRLRQSGSVLVDREGIDISLGTIHCYLKLSARSRADLLDAYSPPALEACMLVCLALQKGRYRRAPKTPREGFVCEFTCWVHVPA